MFAWHWCLRSLPVLAIVAASVVTPVGAQPAPPPAAASLLPADPTWVVNLEPVPLRSGPEESSETLADLRAFTYLAVRGYQGEWAEVVNPRTRAIGFLPSP